MKYTNTPLRQTLPTVRTRLSEYSKLVVLPHSVFAMPFALAALLLAIHAANEEGRPAPFGAAQMLWIVLAVVSARTAAMGFNRLVDRSLDSANPRTSTRSLPAGRLTPREVSALVALSSALFIAFAALLGMHCLVLAPLVLIILFSYSYTKRFTGLSHLVLGFALALAPAGAWWVIRPGLELIPVTLSLAVLFWVSGFDVLYSLQDIAFDREHGLFSIPALLGAERALTTARLLHLAAIVCFVLLGVQADFGPLYFTGLGLLGFILAAEHLMVSPYDIARINTAFFTLNGLFGVLYLMLVVLSL